MTIPENPVSKRNLPLDMEKWRAIISDWESSKENQKTYCERLGIKLNTFTYVRGKLSQGKTIKPSFIPITLTPTDTRSDTVTIENPQGYKLHFSSALSLDRLAKIFKLCGWSNAEVTR